MPTVTVERTFKQIQSLLVGALEGGSNYWYQLDDYRYPEGITYKDFAEGGRFTDPNEYFHPSQIIPTVEGCALVITDQSGYGDGTKYILDRDALTRGVQIMAEKHLRHFADWVLENDDATTADVYLQCCVFGEVIYG